MKNPQSTGGQQTDQCGESTACTAEAKPSGTTHTHMPLKTGTKEE